MTQSWQRIYWRVLSVFVGIAVAISAAPAWAQLQGGRVLQESIEAANNSEEAMDKMWADMFTGQALLYGQVVDLAKVLLIVGFFFLMLSFARAMRDNSIDKVTEIVAWALVVVIFLGNEGAVLKTVTMGGRDFINDRAESILLVQLGSLTVQDALQDVILTDQARDRIQAVFADCEAKEGQAQLDCLKQAGEQATAIVKEYEEAGFFSPGLRRLGGNLKQLNQEMADRNNISPTWNFLWSKEIPGDMAQLIYQSAAGGASRSLLKSFQNWFTYGFEFSMLLTGLLGPLAVAASIIPKQPRALFSWIIAFGSIGILKLSYNLLVGFAAIYAVNAEIQETGDSGFLLMMSIGAPLIAVAIAGGGGAALFFALGRTTAVMATIIPVGGSMASGLVRR